MYYKKCNDNKLVYNIAQVYKYILCVQVVKNKIYRINNIYDIIIIIALKYDCYSRKIIITVLFLLGKLTYVNF